jgi:hypothetical protein
VKIRALCIVGALLAAVATSGSAAPPTTLDDVVVFARDQLRIHIGTRLISGHLVVNEPTGVATMKRSVAALSGTQVVAGTVALRPRAPRPGPTLFDVFANAFDPDATGVNIMGEGPTPLALPLFTFPTAPMALPGTDACPQPGRTAGDCLVRKKDGPVTILPGNYNRIFVMGNGALYFAGGTYHAASIYVAGGGRIFFNAPTTLNVANRARFGRRIHFGPLEESTLNPRCVVMHVNASERAVRIGAISEVAATISAANGPMRLGSFSHYRGNLTAIDVDIGLNVLLEAPPTLASPCE